MVEFFYNGKSSKSHIPEKQPFPSSLFHNNLWGCVFPPLGSYRDTDVDSELIDDTTYFEAVEEAYTATKAMGDADHEVSFISLWFLSLVFC